MKTTRSWTQVLNVKTNYFAVNGLKMLTGAIQTISFQSDDIENEGNFIYFVWSSLWGRQFEEFGYSLPSYKFTASKGRRYISTPSISSNIDKTERSNRHFPQRRKAIDWLSEPKLFVRLPIDVPKRLSNNLNSMDPATGSFCSVSSFPKRWAENRRVNPLTKQLLAPTRYAIPFYVDSKRIYVVHKVHCVCWIKDIMRHTQLFTEILNE